MNMIYSVPAISHKMKNNLKSGWKFSLFYYLWE